MSARLQSPGAEFSTDVAIISVESLSQKSEGFQESVELQLYARVGVSDVWVLQDELLATLIQYDALKVAPSRLLYDSAKPSYRVFLASDEPNRDLSASSVAIEGHLGIEMVINKRVVSARLLLVEIDAAQLEDQDSVELIVQSEGTQDRINLPIVR